MSDDDLPDNVIDIRRAMDQAQPVVLEDEGDGGAIDDAPPMGSEAPPQNSGGTWHDDTENGPPPRRFRIKGDISDWPVRALGVKGDSCFYLDELNQLRELKFKDHSRSAIVSLFGRKASQLYVIHPREKKEGDSWIVTGWKPELYQEDLMTACANQGPWDPTDRVRGAGAWLGENGELILHCGNMVIIVPVFDDTGRPFEEPWEHSEILKPDLIGRAVYPAAPAGPKPHKDKQPAETDGPAEAVLNILNTWTWKHHELDAYMLFGWICAAYLGGAIKWRPHCWITGGAGTGKSSLHKLIDDLLNDMSVSITDPTAAAIWQTLGTASVPVKIDEAEAEEDNRTMNNVIKLSRQAASGGSIKRGGADHKAHEFKINSPFMFSSILVPQLQAQDRSRLAVLELFELENKEPPNTAPKLMNELGSKLFRRVVDGWGRWAQALEQYQAALQKEKFSARACDQYGTLLAAADLALYDGLVPSERAAEWARQVKDADLVSWGDQDKDEDEFLHYLLTSTIDPWRSGSRQTIGELILKAWAPQHGEYPDPDADRALKMHGLRVMQFKEMGGPSPDAPWFLAIANKHRGLEELFKDTRWARGVWKQPAGRLQNSFVPKAAVHIGGTTKVTAVALETMPLGREEMSERGAATRTPNTPNPDQKELV